MATTGIFFQFARGRAIVRKNALRQARAVKARLLRERDTLRPAQIEQLQFEVTHFVRRAREAHRAWRQYRKLHEEVERG